MKITVWGLAILVMGINFYLVIISVVSCIYLTCKKYLMNTLNVTIELRNIKLQILP